MTRNEKNREKHSEADAARPSNPVDVMKNEGRETSHLLKDGALYLFSEEFLRDSLGPFAPLWYLTDYLIPEHFKILRKIFSILWKGILIVALLYIAVATIYYNYFQLFGGTVNK